jgi:hypothetical protein
MAEFAFVLDEGAAGASHSIDNIQSSSQPREYQDNDLNAAGMHAFSVESMAPMYCTTVINLPVDLRNPFQRPLKTGF